MTETRNDFWSRRKARVQQEAEAEARAQEASEVAVREAELEEKSDEEILAEFDLPDPDSLKQGDDFSVFMKHAVPERIRRRALRRLWLSNPVLANLDSLVEYGEDYTDAATVVENLSTAYQVGKGMAKHVMEMERQKAEADARSDGTWEEPHVEESVALSDEETVPSEAETAPDPACDGASQTMVAVDETPISAETVTDEVALPPRRRMRFAFAE